MKYFLIGFVIFWTLFLWWHRAKARIPLAWSLMITFIFYITQPMTNASFDFIANAVAVWIIIPGILSMVLVALRDHWWFRKMK